MTEMEGSSLSTVIAELFPTANQTQIATLVKVLSSYGYGMAREAVESRVGEDMFLNPAAIMTWLKSRTGATNGKQREEQAKSDYRSIHARKMREKQQVDQRWNQVDAYLDELPPEAIERAKSAVFDKYPNLRPFIEKHELKKSPILKTLVMKELAATT